MKRIALLVAAVITALFALSPYAHADDELTDAETTYVLKYSGAICSVLDDHPNENGVGGILEGVIEDGFDVAGAAHIINASVWNFCNRHWDLLNEVNDKWAERAGRTPLKRAE